MNSSIFQRTALLIGSEGMERLAKSNVILFGVGGVGSWCAESLIRSGIRQLTIVDFDKVAESNINRQLMATTVTIGEYKVDVLKKRLLDINPSAEINALKEVYDAETAESFQLDSYDVIIDAIDSIDSKVHLIQTATQTQAAFFSSMGAALKMDSQQIKVAEFWKVHGCPLAATLRRKLRKSMLPATKFTCVFSPELLENKEEITDSTTDIHPIHAKKRVNGTIAHIPAIFGLTLAGLVVQNIIDNK